MLVANLKEKWRAAKLCYAIEERLNVDPIWIESSIQPQLLGHIAKKLSIIAIDSFPKNELVPQTLSSTELTSILFNGFSTLIDQSTNGGLLTKIDYLIINLARKFASNITPIHDQNILKHAKLITAVAINWDKFIRARNQCLNTRFVVLS